MDKLSFDITKMDEGRIRVEVYYTPNEEMRVMMGILYFEKAKRSFNRKPVGMDAWACVDAKVEGLYTVDKAITPPQIVAHCYKLIQEQGL